MSDLQIRLLGDPSVLHDGNAVELPPSKKTRALLVYLAATGRPQLRQRLCDLLWEGPDDPRGALRWSLAKLRPLLDLAPRCRLAADRERIEFVADDADIDVNRLAVLLRGGADLATREALSEAATLLRGEFAEGLDLPNCSRFHEWCTAEREKWAELRLTVLGRLVELLADAPHEALVHARGRTAIDPLNENAHAEVIRLLARLGRQREALRQYEYCRQLLEAELGVPPGTELQRARALLGTPSVTLQLDEQTSAASAYIAPASVEPDLVGRDRECDVIDAIVAAAAAATNHAKFVLLSGEPGIGKTRLLRYVSDSIARAGGEVLAARAFEAEIARPHGVWTDIVERVSGCPMPESIRAGLLPLLASGNDGPKDGDRGRLFGALVELVTEWSSRAPLAILIDDLQWIDEASISLLHYVVRAFDTPCRVLIAATARPGELADNAPAQRLVHGVARAARLVQLALDPLDAHASAALARVVAPGQDIGSVVAAGEGNPLFTLELARGLASGRATLPETIGSALAELLTRLEGPARTILPWASALGRVFDVGVLARCVRLTPQEWLDALEELERRGVVRSLEADQYDFAHDLVRGAAYGQISQPRRRLIHGQIAQALAEVLDTNREARALGGELARHAELGQNDVLAARGFALAGEHSLRVFANEEAIDCAERGLRHLARVATGPERTRLQIALLRVQISASGGTAVRVRVGLYDDVLAAATVAENAGLSADAATGHYLLSELHYEMGDAAAAESSTLRAAEIGRSADTATNATHLATTACCLLMLETGVARSRRLVAEAESMPGSDRQALWLLRGRALLRRWDGELDAAIALFEQARRVAERLEERWQEARIVVTSTMLHLERGDASNALACADAVLPQVSKMREGGELPFVRALQALARTKLREPGAWIGLQSAFAELRAFDSKSRLAYILNTAGEFAMTDGRVSAVRDFAEEALAAAQMTRRVCETVRAKVLLTRALAAAGDPAAARACLQSVIGCVGDRDAVSHSARMSVVSAAAQIGLNVQTLVQTRA